MTGLVKVSSPEAVTQSMQPVEVKDAQVIQSISSHVKNAFSQAQIGKNFHLERLLRCERQRKGMYDPEQLASIRKTGGSDIYMMLTDIKCRAAEAWMRDVLFALGEDTWTISPNAEPKLSPDERESIIQVVVQEQRELQAQGIVPHPASIKQRMGELKDQILKAMKESAGKTCERMQNEIKSQLQEGGFEKAMSEFYSDFTTYPSAFIKGPVVHMKRVVSWDKSNNPVVEHLPRVKFYRVSGYDIYPSAGAVGIQDGYLCERVRYEIADLEGLKGIQGYSDSEIDAVIQAYYRGGLKIHLVGDQERNDLSGHQTAWLSPSDFIEGVEYWGKAAGQMLLDWGMKGIDPHKQYEINCITVGSNTIKCVINPDPLGKRPYFKASFEEMTGMFWGNCPPEMMRDCQIMCNASARSLANNMSIASGPQVDIDVTRLPAGEQVTQMFPWKIWQTTADKTGGGQPAIHFFQPEMKAQELWAVFQSFSKLADEVTGIPNYVYGSGQTSGAGRTASGLAMLMDNAAKGIKQAVGNIDTMMSDIITSMYMHNMLFNPDPTIKGPMDIVARGAIGMLLKEQLHDKRASFLQATANPIDAQIMGTSGRSYLLRETARPLGLDTDKVVPTDEERKEEQLQQQQAQQQAQAQALNAPMSIQFQRGADGALQGANVNPVPVEGAAQRDTAQPSLQPQPAQQG